MRPKSNAVKLKKQREKQAPMWQSTQLWAYKGKHENNCTPKAILPLTSFILQGSMPEFYCSNHGKAGIELKLL